MENRFGPGTPELRNIYRNRNTNSLCRDNPGLNNIIGYERAWKEYPEDLDFLNPESCHRKTKEHQREVYLNLMEPFISGLKKGSSILDVAGGIGRFAIPLAKKGFRVTLTDACLSNLKAARRHAEEHGVQDSIKFQWADMRRMDFLESDTFDAVLGIESVCYCSRPREALREMARLTKPGGPVFLSVEGKYGSILSDRTIGVKNLREVLRNSRLLVKDSVYTRYFTRNSLREILKESGLKIKTLRGCHYGPDGVFQNIPERLWKVTEKTCSRIPLLKNLARAWFAVCEVKK